MMTTLEKIVAELKRQHNNPGVSNYLDLDDLSDVCIDGWFDLVALAAAVDGTVAEQQ